MKDPKVTKKSMRVYQVLDLQDIFGVDFSKNKSLAESIVQVMLDNMKDRIAAGKDINNDPMKPYSKEYKKSNKYIAARKTGTVNMELTGDMLGSIDIIKETKNKVTIGFTDRQQELKAHGHMTGYRKPVREFFGINEDDVEAARSEFRAALEKAEK